MKTLENMTALHYPPCLKTALRDEVPSPALSPEQTALGCPRDDLGQRFVYLVVSPRARGLSIGVNMNPDKSCNFDCVYCEVNRAVPSRDTVLDTEAMATELLQTLTEVKSGRVRERPAYSALPAPLLKLQHVALSGDGEPTLSPKFAEAVETVMHVRALARPFFKIVLITNSTGLDLPGVQDGLKLFTQTDEIWAKLEAGTEPYLAKVNRPKVCLEKVLSNILGLGQKRSIVIQSLFPLINGEEPGVAEIEEYASRLRELKDKGAQISLVQIYSATRPTPHSECAHLPLKSLSRIAQTVRRATGLRAEVF
jgi:wyosine [tRNA(Phe)-imidazoG37] synthetase (radical SAM superfamily)